MKRLVAALLIVAATWFVLTRPAGTQTSVAMWCWNQYGTGMSQWQPCGTSTPLVISGITEIPTYRTATTAIANTGAGDLYCISGSATKTVHVLRMRISAIASAAIAIDATVVKRSSAPSGGTPVAMTMVPNDSLNAAATAVGTAFSASPTPGAAVGTIAARKLAIGTQGNSNTIGDEAFDFTIDYGQAVVLRGTSQQLCLNVTAAGTGASYNVGSTHTEQ